MQHPSAKGLGYLLNLNGTPATSWEAANYDIAVASSLPLVQLKTERAAIPVGSYTVLQYMAGTSPDKYNWLLDYCETHSLASESMFVHLAQDSVFNLKAGSGGYTMTRPWGCYFYNGSTYSHKGDWWDNPGTVFAFGATVGHVLYVGMLDKFDEVNFVIQSKSSGTFAAVWEYWNGSAWTTLTCTDGTSGLRADGQVTFTPPSNWARKLIYSNSGIDFKGYFVRLRVTATGVTPSIGGANGITMAAFTYNVGGTNYFVPGWDEAADTDHDGYNPSPPSGASAKFKWQSRLSGRGYWSAYGFRFYTGSSVYLQAFTAYALNVLTTAQSGFTYDSLYLDEVAAGVNYYLYTATGNPISGGLTYEYGANVPPSSAANTQATNDCAAFLTSLRASLNGIGKELYCTDGSIAAFVPHVDGVLLEVTCYDVSQYSTWFSPTDSYGWQKKASAAHANSAKVFLQGQQNLDSYLGATATVIARSHEFMFACFLIVQDDVLDYFRCWKGTLYSSAQGVPQSHWPAQFKNDLGAPTGVVPTGYTPLSGSDQPLFIFATGTCPSTGKTYKVTARDYAKALVLAKARPDGATAATATFSDVSATTHALPATTDNPSGNYYRVNPDGSINYTAITSVSLRNAEGALLLKADIVSVPGSVPADPSSLAATAVSPTEIDLTWTDNSNNEAGFYVERKTGVGGTYAQIATAPANNASYADTTVLAGTTYYYRVRAFLIGVGNSGYSNEAHATTPSPTAEPPSAAGAMREMPPKVWPSTAGLQGPTRKFADDLIRQLQNTSAEETQYRLRIQHVFATDAELHAQTGQPMMIALAEDTKQAYFWDGTQWRQLFAAAAPGTPSTLYWADIIKSVDEPTITLADALGDWEPATDASLASHEETSIDPHGSHQEQTVGIKTPLVDSGADVRLQPASKKVEIPADTKLILNG